MITGHNHRPVLEQRARELDGLIATAWDGRDRAVEAVEMTEMELDGSCQPARALSYHSAREALRRKHSEVARLRDERAEILSELSDDDEFEDEFDF